MILPFQKQFVEPILDGSKLHTIREDKPGRWKARNKIHAATGVRTPKYHCFFESKCVSTQSIEIEIGPSNRIIVLIDGNLFYRQTEEAITNVIHKKRMNKLAINDGFEDMHQFFKWFDTDYKGKIIHWTDLRY